MTRRLPHVLSSPPVIETLDSTAWKTQTVQTINASVYKDTARFESLLVPWVASNMRCISSPLECVRLDIGAIDTLRVDAASKLVLNIRKRAVIESTPGKHVLYFYTKAANGRDLLGFSQFTGAIDGCRAATPTPFVFGTVATAGETYWHELAHAAFMVRTPRFDASVEKPLSRILGGTLHRTWAEIVCEEQSLVLKPVGAANLAAFFATAEEQLDAQSLRNWENACFIDYMIAKSGDQALRMLINVPYNITTRVAAQTNLA